MTANRAGGDEAPKSDGDDVAPEDETPPEDTSDEADRSATRAVGGAGDLVAADDDDEEVLEGILDELSPERREQLVEIVSVVTRSHRGPLPDPASFAAYEAAVPGTGKAITDGATEYRRHKMRMDEKIANTARLSLVLTFVAVLVTLGIATWLAFEGHLVLAGLFGAGGLSPVFVGMLRGGGRWSGK